MPRLRRAVLVGLAIAAALAALAGPAQAANPKLIGEVNDDATIRLKDANGNVVTVLEPGTYDVEVHDNSDDHNFHLSGPGVNQATAVAEVGVKTWTVTFAGGATYTYVCDPHAGFMRGSFTTTGGADVGVTTADSPDPVTVGAELTYTETGTNRGADATTSLTLTTTLPAEVAFVSASPSQGSCTGSTTISCALGALARDGQATVTIVVTTRSPGSLTKTSEVSASPGDPNPGNNRATVTTSVTAPGAPPPASFPLAVTKAGAGAGTVTSEPAGIECGQTCAASFPAGTRVTLRADAARGSIFVGWTGACSGLGACTVTMDAAKDVRAAFAKRLAVRILAVRVVETPRARQILVRVRVSRDVVARLRLERRRKAVATRRVSLQEGRGAARLTVPRRADAGPYMFVMRFEDAFGDRRVHTRRVVLGD